MKKFLALVYLSLILAGCKNENRNRASSENAAKTRVADTSENHRKTPALEVEPIAHATAVITWEETVIYIDPVGGPQAFEGKPAPDLILITDIHQDHLDAKTLQAIEKSDHLRILVPQAVKEELPREMEEHLVVLNNGETKAFQDVNIRAIPMYNLPEDDPESFHTKGRGNGYVLEKDDYRLYISGDTEDIPEMRNLQDIDLALVCMNLPYTMTVEQAADAVADFNPKKVYPYHYRGQNGYSDVEKFKELLEEKTADVAVVLLDWYPRRSGTKP